MSKNTLRILLLAAVFFGLVISDAFCQSQGIASVFVQLPSGNVKAETPFSARVKNGLATPITFCVDFGQTVQTASGRHAAPNPFEIQKWNGKRWDTQLTGTDVGSGSTAISVDAHESKDFSLQINASGRYRLRLTYIEGESEPKCPLAPEHASRIGSNPFSVRALTEK